MLTTRPSCTSEFHSSLEPELFADDKANADSQSILTQEYRRFLRGKEENGSEIKKMTIAVSYASRSILGRSLTCISKF